MLLKFAAVDEEQGAAARRPGVTQSYAAAVEFSFHLKVELASENR